MLESLARREHSPASVFNIFSSKEIYSLQVIQAINPSIVLRIVLDTLGLAKSFTLILFIHVNRMENSRVYCLAKKSQHDDSFYVNSLTQCDFVISSLFL